MKTLVIAPHADDELIGCGGTLLRRADEGNSLGLFLATSIFEEDGWSADQVSFRKNEIEQVRQGLRIEIADLFKGDFPTARLDQFSMSDLIKKISEVVTIFQPEEIFLPHPGDAHSDHRIVFEAAMTCTKWFRYPSVRRVYAYETLSETNFSIDTRFQSFRPNIFVNISGYLEKKIELLRLYESEMGEFPFPRSEIAIRSLAQLRGSEAGFIEAEGFMLLKERVV